MPLTLRALSLNGQPITQPITAKFGAEGGSVGRADTNTLALPDPERRISRHQAEISSIESGYRIKNVGSANPIIVREQSLTLGESAPLRAGDQVRIGGYLLEVESEEAPGDDRTSIDLAVASPHPFAGPQGAQANPAPAAARVGSRSDVRSPASSPFADLGGPLSAGNPFAELLGDPAASAPSSARGGRGSAPPRLPDDFDPFAAPSPPPAIAAPPPARLGGAFEDLIPRAAPASIDSLFGLAPASNARDPLADFLAGTPIADSAGAAASLTTDPLALFGSDKEGHRPGPVAEAPPDRTPELRAVFAPPKPMPAVPSRSSLRDAAAMPAQPPRPAAPQAAAENARPAADPPVTARPASPPSVPMAARDGGEETTEPPAAGWSPDALAVWHALCEGAGVRLDPPPNTGPAFMRVVGMMLRSSVEGTVQLMAMRQATRQELQAQVTVIRPKNNNPLKFAPDGQSAMEQVLQPAVRGFLPGPAAMTDAMNDLLGHAIGTMAGTRAALEGVLKRFGPQELEAKLASKSVLDSVLPMNRKAKLWELYLQHYESIRDEAQEDFHTLFGRAFLAAYEQQLERLRREKSAAPK